MDPVVPVVTPLVVLVVPVSPVVPVVAPVSPVVPVVEPAVVPVVVPAVVPEVTPVSPVLPVVEPVVVPVVVVDVVVPVVVAVVVPVVLVPEVPVVVPVLPVVVPVAPPVEDGLEILRVTVARCDVPTSARVTVIVPAADVTSTPFGCMVAPKPLAFTDHCKASGGSINSRPIESSAAPVIRTVLPATGEVGGLGMTISLIWPAIARATVLMLP